MKLFDLNNLMIKIKKTENENIPVIFIPTDAPAKIPEIAKNAKEDFVLEQAIARKKIDNEIKHAK